MTAKRLVQGLLAGAAMTAVSASAAWAKCDAYVTQVTPNGGYTIETEVEGARGLAPHTGNIGGPFTQAAYTKALDLTTNKLTLLGFEVGSKPEGTSSESYSGGSAARQQALEIACKRAIQQAISKIPTDKQPPVAPTPPPPPPTYVAPTPPPPPAYVAPTPPPPPTYAEPQQCVKPAPAPVTVIKFSAPCGCTLAVEGAKAAAQAYNQMHADNPYIEATYVDAPIDNDAANSFTVEVSKRITTHNGYQAIIDDVNNGKKTFRFVDYDNDGFVDGAESIDGLGTTLEAFLAHHTVNAGPAVSGPMAKVPCGTKGATPMR